MCVCEFVLTIEGLQTAVLSKVTNCYFSQNNNSEFVTTERDRNINMPYVASIFLACIFSSQARNTWPENFVLVYLLPYLQNYVHGACKVACVSLISKIIVLNCLISHLLLVSGLICTLMLQIHGLILRINMLLISCVSRSSVHVFSWKQTNTVCEPIWHTERYHHMHILGLWEAFISTETTRAFAGPGCFNFKWNYMGPSKKDSSSKTIEILCVPFFNL